MWENLIISEIARTYGINYGKVANSRIQFLEKRRNLFIFAIEKRQADLLPSIMIV